MTIYTSQMISGMVGQQLGMFGGYGGYAQQIGPGMYPQQMPQYGAMGAMRRGLGGIYGEQQAMRAGNAMNTAMGVGVAGLGVMSAFSPIPMDPFSGAVMGARFGLGGAAMGAAGGAAMGMPLFMAGQAAQVYGGAFTGGMQDQAALNSTLRNNFQHFGGQGAFGRGFSQQQMGQVGQMISGELRRNPFSSAGEMNNLISGGAEAGMFTAVRDVQQFTQRFRTMLNTLKDVQRELGGTLTDALQFTRTAQQAGIFRNSEQVNFAAEIRSAEAVTGMDRNQLVALSAQGSQISRSVGGLGRQGAMGALRGAQTLGAAISSGAINQEMLSEATGGLTGSEAISAFTSRMMERSGRFSRTGMGRFSLFALSNEDGTGLDQDMLARFNAGDLTTGDVSRRAHSRVNRMGRARAMNREGMLRGAVMEEGGLASQIGMMRLVAGDRVMDQSDDMGSLVLQRRFHMSRPESEMMMSLMRNQSRIAETESIDRMGARRQTDMARDITENRSFDSFVRHLEHGMSDTMGVTRARELGRSFLTRISTVAERAMNEILGSTGSSLSTEDNRAMMRMFTGRASSSDVERVTMRHATAAGVTGNDMVNAESLFARPLAGSMLHSMGFHTAPTAGEFLSRRGVTGLGGANAGVNAREAMDRVSAARSGLLYDEASQRALVGLEGNMTGTLQRIDRAALASVSDASRFHQFMGGNANATDAFMARHGMRTEGGDATSLSTVGMGSSTLGGALSAAFAQTPAEQSAAFFGGGNETYMAGLRRRAGRASGTGATDRGEGLLRRSGYTEEEIAASSGRAARREDVQSAAILETMGGIRQETLQSVMESEGFRSRAGSILGATGTELTDRLNDLSQYAGGLEDKDQRTAARSVVEQLRAGVSNGRLGDRERQALMAGSIDQRRIDEIRSQRNQYAASLGGMMDSLQGSGADSLVASLGRAREAWMGTDDPMAASTQVRTDLSRMDTSSEAYGQVSQALGRTEAGRALLAAGASDRHLRREMTGRGRRGSAGAADAALGAVTGGSLSEMEFEVGGRTIRGSDRGASRQLMGILRRGDSSSTALMHQLEQRLTGMGVTGDDATNMVTTLSAGVQNGRGGLSEAATDQLMQMTGSNRELDRVRAEGSQRQQQARDPLGHERNQILTRMETSLGAIRDKLPGLVNSESSGEAG